MAFDGITMAGVVYSLKNQLLGARINKIAQPEMDELLLTIKPERGQVRLLLSASPSLPLITLLTANKPSPMTAPNFCMLLRKYINNGRIVSITQPGLERIVFFDIEHPDELGDITTHRLIVEIMGKHSNIILCDCQGKIVDSIKHIPSSVSSIREVLPGRDYFIPDTMKKIDPLTLSTDNFFLHVATKSTGCAKALYTSLTGLSPMAAHEICYQSGIEPDCPISTLSEDVLLHLYRQLTYFLEPVKNGIFTPTLYLDKEEPKEYSLYPCAHFSHCQAIPYSDVFSLFKDYYAKKDQLMRIRQKSSSLRQIVQTSLERNQKKYDLQLKQLNDTKNRDQYRVYGELLHTYGYHIPAKATEFTTTNFYTGQEVTIPLDASKTPGENAQRYFERYNKQKRTYEALCVLLKETKEEIDYLFSIQNALAFSRTEDDLADIRSELEETGYIKRHRGSKNHSPKKSHPLHYLSFDGFHIYVGKNNFQNEYVSFTLAEADDWWFHAKGCPGSHVIVKCHGEELPDRTFEEAGRLAAYYSQNSGGDKVEIDYTKRRNIKKVKGGKPGLVIYHTNYSLVIDSDIRSIKEIS